MQRKLDWAIGVLEKKRNRSTEMEMELAAEKDLLRPKTVENRTAVQ